MGSQIVRHDWVTEQVNNSSLVWINYLIYLFLAELGLCCCAWSSSSYCKQGLLTSDAWVSHCGSFAEPRLKGTSVQFSSVTQSCSTLYMSGTLPWTAAHQAFLSITNSWSLLILMSIESVMPFNHLILCHPLLLPSSIFPSIRVFSNESVLCIRWPKYWIQLQHEPFQWIFRTDFL